MTAATGRSRIALGGLAARLGRAIGCAAIRGICSTRSLPNSDWSVSTISTSSMTEKTIPSWRSIRGRERVSTSSTFARMASACSPVTLRLAKGVCPKGPSALVPAAMSIVYAAPRSQGSAGHRLAGVGRGPASGGCLHRAGYAGLHGPCERRDPGRSTAARGGEGLSGEIKMPGRQDRLGLQWPLGAGHW